MIIWMFHFTLEKFSLRYGNFDPIAFARACPSRVPSTLEPYLGTLPVACSDSTLTTATYNHRLLQARMNCVPLYQRSNELNTQVGTGLKIHIYIPTQLYLGLRPTM